MKDNGIAYLTFSLGDEKFAIPVENVQEIVEFGQVTKVPGAPPYMLGIINLRGRVLPLLDTKIKLGLPPSVTTKRSRIMVLDMISDEGKALNIGAIVDVAREVVEIFPNEIQPATEVTNLNASAPVTGIVNNGGDVTMIMDILKVFSLQDIETTSIN